MGGTDTSPADFPQCAWYTAVTEQHHETAQDWPPHGDVLTVVEI